VNNNIKLLWVKGSVVGWILGIAVFELAWNILPYRFIEDYRAICEFLSLLAGGFLFGFLQWQILRTRSRVSVMWMPIAALTFFFVNIFTGPISYSDFDWIGVALIASIVITFLQLLVIGNHISHRRYWILVSALSLFLILHIYIITYGVLQAYARISKSLSVVSLHRGVEIFYLSTEEPLTRAYTVLNHLCSVIAIALYSFITGLVLERTMVHRVHLCSFPPRG